MKKNIFILICLCCAFFRAMADPMELNSSDANIIGHVIDSKTGEHLSYINVVLKGTTIGAMTDLSGHYFLKNLPEGVFTLEVSALGYQSQSRQITLKRGKTIEANFEIAEDVVALDGVVVSANRALTTRKLSPALVNVVDMQTFENANACNLAQGLNFQPGVRVENNCQNCGYQQVRINGLEGPYTQILIDSRPIFNALSGVYGLEQIPANMIERVEVMRGGGSALSGASAIGGSINVITREPLRNSAQIAHSLTGVGGLSAFDNNTTLNASLVTDNHKAGIYVFGQHRNRAAFDYDGDGFSELPALRNQTLGFRSYLKTSLYTKLTFEYHHLNEFRRGGDKMDRPPHEADIAEQIESDINGGGLKFDYFSPNEKHHLNVFASAQHTKRDSYYGGGQDLNAYGATTDFTWLMGTQYNYLFDQCLFMPAELTGGIEYSSDRLEDNMWGYNRYTKQHVQIVSSFLQNEWKNRYWSFLLGGRLDKHNLMNHVIFSPRANLRYNPKENINIRLSYSSGFRAPQAFDEDLHIENVGGTVSMIERNGNLKEEKSQSVSLSGDFYRTFGAFQANLLIEGFFTRLSDVFILEDIGKEDDILIKSRRNGSGARVMGMTLEGKVAYKDKVQLQGGVTLQQSRYDEAEKWSDTAPAERKMFRTPNTYGYFTASYMPVKPLSIALSGTYTGEMLVGHRAGVIAEDRAERTPDFFDVNMKVAYDFDLYKDIKLQLNGGVQNIFNAYQSDFDKGKLRDSGYIYGPAMPRSYFFGVKLSY
ncbi:MAG: TonB-dependent receptor [Bacteroidales bacterium]